MTAPAGGSAEPMIRLEGVHKSFGSLHVLKGIDLVVRSGSVVCVSIVNDTGPTFASVRSCFAFATSRVYSGYCDVGSA